ncbi:MAG: T9SS type A sorting domain-containing protein [Candidatus Marinimicrobia bacterium]|nr:T9SS type A sorting domain-containing protein [Candidatus Neomarinimicrobiota bacterium]
MHFDDSAAPPTYISGNGLTGSTGDDPDFDSNNYVSYGDLSLPVELTYFTGKSTYKGITLTWETTSEFENLGYAIERREGDSQQAKVMTSYLKNPALEGAGSTAETSQYSWTDTQVKPGYTYHYTLTDVDYQGQKTSHKALDVTYVQPDKNLKPTALTLTAVYPNPFNPSANINFSLQEQTELSIAVFNSRGQKVATITEQQTFSAGDQSVSWIAADLPAGIYFINLQSARNSITQKVVKLN